MIQPPSPPEREGWKISPERERERVKHHSQCHPFGFGYLLFLFNKSCYIFGQANYSIRYLQYFLTGEVVNRGRGRRGGGGGGGKQKSNFVAIFSYR